MGIVLKNVNITGGKLSSTPLPQSGIEYFEPNKILFNNITYATYDAKWRIDNGLYYRTPPTNPIYKQELDFNSADPFNTLLQYNIFSNKSRFTDNIGTAITTLNNDNSEIYDHLTGRIYVFITGVQFRNWADSLALKQTDGLYIPSREEYMSLRDMRVTGVIQINNISATLLGSSRHPWTCNVDQSNTLNAIRIDNNNFPTLSLARTSTSRSTLYVKFI
jgi:hypothetical protein